MPNIQGLDVDRVLVALLVLVSGCDATTHDGHPGSDGGIDEKLGGDLTAAASPSQAAPNYPVFEMAPPIRPEDLKPGYVARLSPSPGHRWHDLNIVRWDGRWEGHEPGATTEHNETDWGMPVYSGVDGEVVDCWRNSPYVEDHADVVDIQPHGGNYVTIRTADDEFVYYAHMDTNSIPSSVCPNASADGWMDKSDRIDCLLASKCMTTDTYLGPGERPQVKAGQYLGRIGAHGNARGAHLHIHVGYVIEDANGLLNTFDDDPHHLVFDRAWFKPQSGSTDVTAWAPAHDDAGQSELIQEADEGYTLLWPAAKAQATFTASYRMGDYDGDGEDDLLCQSTSTGTVWVDLAWSGQLNGTNWSRAGGWCSSAMQRLHTGDFDGDGRDDLLCHDLDSGNLWVDLANASGEFHGTNFTTGGDWCSADTQQLRVGDFDADGDDDLLCHDHIDGRMWVDHAEPGTIFAGTDSYIPGGWCYGKYQRLHTGRLDGDIDDDLLCHDTRSGTLYFDYAQGGTFGGTDNVKGSWCMGGGQRLMVANVEGAGNAELVCFDSDDGKVYVDRLPYDGTDWVSEGNDWCDEPHQRVRLGDVDGDGSDDLVCFDEVTGQRWVDYAADPSVSGAIFEGTDWSSAGLGGWCNGSTQGLH